jgi:hypothetical protein
MNHIKLTQILLLALGISIAFNIGILHRPQRTIKVTDVQIDTKGLDSLTAVNLGLIQKILFLDSQINYKDEQIKNIRYINRTMPADSVQRKFTELIQAERYRLGEGDN